MVGFSHLPFIAIFRDCLWHWVDPTLGETSNTVRTYGRGTVRIFPWPWEGHKAAGRLPWEPATRPMSLQIDWWQLYPSGLVCQTWQSFCHCRLLNEHEKSTRWCSIRVGKPPFLAFKGHTHISTVLVACFTLIVLYTTCIFAGLPNHLTDCCPTLPTEYCLRPQHPFIRNQNHACSSTCHCPRPEISGDFGKRMGSKSLELMVVEANQPGLGYF